MSKSNDKTAYFWLYYYRVIKWFTIKSLGKLNAALAFILGSSFTLTLILFALYLDNIGKYFKASEHIISFQNFLLSLGGALISSTAIAFSLIMFAMQVNLERIPYGLFRKFGSDFKLISSFFTTFIIAISITSLSQINVTEWMPYVIFYVFWSSIVLLLLLKFSYARALKLINPTEQLSILVNDTQKNLNIWSKRADRISRLIPIKDGDHIKNFDIKRFKYFRLNAQWTQMAVQNITHCFYFAKQYSQKGDHEVGEFALNCVVQINSLYIEAKGKTFISQNPLVENLYSNDSFINHTLEKIRQHARTGLTLGDEAQIEQSFYILYELCIVYMNISYETEDAEKHHASLASSYLASAVNDLISHNLSDLAMSGIRHMGATAQLLLQQDDIIILTSVSNKIIKIAETGIINDQYKPLILVSIEELTKLIINILVGRERDISFVVGKIQRDITSFTMKFLEVPSPPFKSIHSNYLKPFYSSISSETFLDELHNIANGIADSDEGDLNATIVISNIIQWAEEIHYDHKKIFLSAVSKKSSFTFDILHWISNIANIYLTISTTSACSEHNSGELQKKATQLIAIFTWVPDEKNTIEFVENYNITSTLFGVALKAHSCGCSHISHEIGKQILNWCFKAAKYDEGIDALTNGLFALVCLNLILKLEGDELTNAVDQKLKERINSNSNLKITVIKTLTDMAKNLDSNLIGINLIENKIIT